ALIGCLARSWDRLEPYARVTAANPDNGWIHKGDVDAWWISQAASVPWLGNGRGRPTAPGELRVRTLTNEAMYGNDPALYLAEEYEALAHREVLSALGVKGNPTVAALITKIEQIRTLHQSGQAVSPDGSDGQAMTVEEAADFAAPFYQALAAEVHGGIQRVGN